MSRLSRIKEGWLRICGQKCKLDSIEYEGQQLKAMVSRATARSLSRRPGEYPATLESPRIAPVYMRVEILKSMQDRKKSELILRICEAY